MVGLLNEENREIGYEEAMQHVQEQKIDRYIEIQTDQMFNVEECLQIMVDGLVQGKRDLERDIMQQYNALEKGKIKEIRQKYLRTRLLKVILVVQSILCQSMFFYLLICIIGLQTVIPRVSYFFGGLSISAIL